MRKHARFWTGIALTATVGFATIALWGQHQAQARAESPIIPNLSPLNLGQRKGKWAIMRGVDGKMIRVYTCAYCDNRYTTPTSPYYRNTTWYSNCRNNPACT